MASTAYTDGVSVVTADTMNDLNRLHYTILSDPADAAAVRTALAVASLGVTAGTARQTDQAVTATTRAATTTLGTSLNHTLSDTSTTITAFNGVAGVTYSCRALGAGSITHHATNLIITQGSADLTTAAGMTFDVEMITSTTSRIKNVMKADGTAVVSAAGLTAGTPLVMNPYVSGNTQTQAHGLGAIPILCVATLECLTAEFGYSIGDIIELSAIGWNTGGTAASNIYISGANIIKTSTNLQIVTAGAPTVVHKTTFTATSTPITAASWKLTITPYKL